MEGFVQRSSFRKHLDVLVAKIKIALKENKEYKANLWGVILSDFFVFGSYVVFFFIYNVIVGDILDWDNLDFLVYLMLLFLAGKIMWSFSLIHFGIFLLNGGLNNYLVRPVNSYFMSSLNHLMGATFPTALMMLAGLVVFLSFGSYGDYVLSFFLFFFGVLFYILFVNFFYSVAFFMKRGEFIGNLFNRNVLFVVEDFTPKMFGSVFFYLLPPAVYGYFVIESLKGNFEIFLFYFYFIMGLVFLLVLGTFLLWHYGLKRYEGFG
jgi:ABC-type uncharacterized transport system permease subunit